MTYLLDTHIWLWMAASPERMRPAVLTLVSDTGNRLLLSAASSWEIAVKHGIGRLALPEPPEEYVPERMRRTGVEGLNVTHRHALRVATLPPHHRDPFDRLLIAQSQAEGVPVVTADALFERYEIDVVMAT